jgi:glutathione S-transferase
MIVHFNLVILMLIGSLVKPAQAFFAPSLSTSRPRSTILHLSNPFSSMLGDMVSSFLGGGGGNVNPTMDATLTTLGPSWETVRETLVSLQTPEERKFRDNLAKGYGPASPLHKVRLYDESNREDEIRVTFYRDSASWCPYCQKVWLTLEEKKIPYRIEKINMSCYGDKPASFMKMQPGGQIPVATIDGKIYGQSNDIIYALEELFPDSKSLAPADRMKAQKLLRLERSFFSGWLSWLSGSERNKGNFLVVLQEVEDVLAAANGPFFMGKEVTMVDFQYAPFLERMAASILFFKGFMTRVPKGTKTDYPALNEWFDAMEQLDSYRLTKSDYYTHCWDLPPQLGGCTTEPAGEIYQNAINGERLLDGSRGSWELPLEPHNGGVEPDWEWTAENAKLEAVERISVNFDAIVNFAARGAGRKGFPSYRATLADPTAVPSDEVKVGVHACLQVVCMALLEGTEQHTDSMQKISRVVKEGGNDYAQGVVDSLAYLRDRVGVPRDMRLHAARQLRAHLNWAIGTILDA